MKPDALAGYFDGVAVNDTDRAGDVLGYFISGDVSSRRAAAMARARTLRPPNS